MNKGHNIVKKRHKNKNLDDIKSKTSEKKPDKLEKKSEKKSQTSEKKPQKVTN